MAVKAVRAVQASAARVRIRLSLGGRPVACAGGVDVNHLADVRLELQKSGVVTGGVSVRSSWLILAPFDSS